MTRGVKRCRGKAGAAITVVLLTLLAGCGEDDATRPEGDPNAPFRYGIYGFAGEELGSMSIIRLVNEGTLVGTEADGPTFELPGYGSFVVYIPPESGRIRIDAIGLGGRYVDSSTEHAHYTSNVEPTGSTWEVGDSYIEGPPDGRTIENGPGRAGWYGFSLLGEHTLRLYFAAIR